MDHQPPINLVVDGSLWVHFVDALNLVQTCGHGGSSRWTEEWREDGDGWPATGIGPRDMTGDMHMIVYVHICV